MRVAERDFGRAGDETLEEIEDRGIGAPNEENAAGIWDFHLPGS